MTEGRLTASDRSAFTSIEQNADSGNVSEALQEAREYLNQNPNNPQLISDMTAEMERNGVLPLLLVEAFGNSADIASELSAFDDNHDGILSRDELVNGAGDNASILFGQLLADRLNVSEEGESISSMALRFPQVLSDYQSYAPELSTVELSIGLLTPIQTTGGSVTLFDLIDNAHGGARDGLISYRDIEHFIYWAEHDPSNGWSQAILDAGLTLDDLRSFQGGFDQPPYNSLRIGGNGDITRDSLLNGSGYDVESGSFLLRDESGRISEIHYANGTTRSFGYDQNGKLTSVVQPDGTVIVLNPTTSVWEVNGQPFAKDITVTADGQMAVIRDGTSSTDGSPITVIGYYELDGNVTTSESRSVLTGPQMEDRAAVIRDALAQGNTDMVITLLTSMTSADLLVLSDYYRTHYGIDLAMDGTVAQADRPLLQSALSRVGDSEADFVSAVDHALLLTDPARREEALRNIFSTMSSEQIAQLEERWSNQHNGQSLRELLFSDSLNLSDGTVQTLEIYLRGTDVNFSGQASDTGEPTTIYMNDQDAVQLGIIALENRNLEMFAEAMRTASPEARAYFAENGEGRNAFLRAFGLNNSRANDYVEWGELTLATIIPENANLLWTYTDRISTALINIPEDQRALYARGRELTMANAQATTEEDQQALAYYNELNGVLRNYAHGALAGFNPFIFAQWESQLLYGDSLINQVMSLEQSHTLGIGGTYHDRDEVMSLIENMPREDWERLFVQDAYGNYPYREMLLASLDTMLSDDEMNEVRGMISRMVAVHDQAAEDTETTDSPLTGETAPDAYQISLEQGARALDEVIAENSWDAVIGWRYEPADIINGILNMSDAEQELYRQNTYVEGKGNYRDYIDGLLRDRLDNGPEMQLAILLLGQIADGGEPQMGPLAQVLYADLTNVPAGELISDIEAIFDPNTLNDETIPQAERDLIARIQTGETVEIANGVSSTFLNRDYFVRIASEALVSAHVYVPFHSTFERLSRDPNSVLWSLFDPNGDHSLPLELELRLADGSDQRVLQAVLNASPEELKLLQDAIAAGGGPYLDMILSQLDEEDRQAVLQVLTNALSAWDGQSALQFAPEDEIRLVTLGVWEDSNYIETLLQNPEAGGTEQILASYSAKYGDMHADVLNFIGEDDEATYARFDRLLSTRGDFDARETFFDHMFDYFDIRTGLAANASPVIGARDTARMVFDDFGAELSELLGANMSPEQHAEFESRIIETLSEFSEAKASFTEQFVMAAETIVGIGCAFIPGLQVFSAKVLLSMFIAGGLMRVKMRDIMLGNEYDWNNQGTDFLLGGIQMAANVLGPDLIISKLPVFRNVLAGSLDNLLVRGVEIADDYLDDFGRGIVNAIQAGGELSDDAAKALAAQCGLPESAASIIREVVNNEIANNFTRAGRIATEILANVGTGSIAGGITGGFDAALHIPQGADAYEALNFILGSAAMGAASGAGGAILFTAGFKLVGTIFRGLRGETVIRPGEDTTVIRADGTTAQPENGLIEVRPGDQVLVDGQPAALEAEPIIASEGPLNADADGPLPETVNNNMTPEEVVGTRGRDFPGGLDENGDPLFFRDASNYTPEQRAAIREFFANSEYALANPERFDQWVKRADEIFAGWSETANETAELIITKHRAERRLRTSIRQMMREMGEDWPAELTQEAILENPSRLQDFLNSADAAGISDLDARIATVNDAINSRAAVDNTMQQRITVLQSYLDDVCDEAGLPRVRLEMDHSPTRLGGYYEGTLYLKDSFFLSGRHGAKTLLHELLHHNQETLIIWRLADSLGMSSPNPPEWRIRQLVDQYNRLTGLDVEYDAPMFRELLAMRNGQRLRPQETVLANELLQTWGQHVDLGEVQSRLNAVNSALNSVRDPYTRQVSLEPYSVQYAKNYIREHAEELIRAGYSGRDIGRWTDQEAVENLFEYLTNQSRALNKEYDARFVQYASATHEWDAQMFGFMADDASTHVAGDVPENVPPVDSGISPADNPNIHALMDEPDADFDPNSSDIFDEDGNRIGRRYQLEDGSFQARYDDGMIVEFDRLEEFVRAYVPQENGGYYYEYPAGNREYFSPEGELLGRMDVAPDGVQTFYFANETRFERYYPDGSFEVHSPDSNTIEFYSSHGDLQKTEIRTNGGLDIVYPNGRREVVSADITLERTALTDFARLEMDAPRAQRFEQMMTSFRARALQAGIPEAEIAIAYRQINRLLSNEGGTVMSLADRMLVAEQLLYMAANPTRINQGMTMGCQVACLQKVLLARDPAALFGMVADVATTGRFVTADDIVVDMTGVRLGLTFDADAIRTTNAGDGSYQNFGDLDADSRRNGASQIIQSTLSNVEFARQSSSSMVIRYERIFDPLTLDPSTYVPPANAGLIGDHGIWNPQLGDLYYQVTGQRSTPFIIEFGPTRANLRPEYIVKVTTTDELVRQLRLMEQNGTLPAIVAVDVSNNPFAAELANMNSASANLAGRHVVTIHGIREVNGKWVVDLSNQWIDATEHIGQNALDADVLLAAMQPNSSNTPPAPSNPQDLIAVDTGERRNTYRVTDGVETLMDS